MLDGGTDDPNRLRQMLFGTDEAVPESRRVRAGDLEAELSLGTAWRIAWRGVEVVRAIDCPIRGEGWSTFAQEAPTEQWSGTATEFACERSWTVGGGVLECRVAFRGSSEGRFEAEAHLTPRRDFRTCRAGFTVLHPLAGLVGEPLSVLRPDGSAERTAFPRLISPGQPVFDIAGLDYRVGGVRAEILFSGDIFEMEDQRNWTDASFKTYCRPLRRPWPYVLSAGTPVRQRIEVRLSGRPKAGRAAPESTGAIRLHPTGERLPGVALILDGETLPSAGEAAVARQAGASSLKLRVRPSDAAAVLQSAVDLAAGRPTEHELEIILPSGEAPNLALDSVARACAAAGVEPARVMALPEAYLRNYQPTDPPPPGPTPGEAIVRARARFPRARIGAGMLTHFTEVNRCRPVPGVFDYLTHGTCANFHAADDRTVIDNLRGLKDVIASGAILAGKAEYRLGLVSIGLRTNPHGPAVADNPAQVRLAAAGADPRARALFGAAWAVGAVAATEPRGVASLALAAPVGPFGLVHRPLPWPQPLFDGRPEAKVYPIFHAVRALASLAGAPRLALAGLPGGVAAVGALTGRHSRLIFSNLSGEAQTVILPGPAWVRRLDPKSFACAIADPLWLDTSAAERASAVELGAYAIAVVELEPRMAGA